MAKDHGAAELLGRITVLPDNKAIAPANWLSGIMPVDEHIPDASRFSPGVPPGYGHYL